MAGLLEVRDVQLRFGGITALAGVGLSVATPEIRRYLLRRCKGIVDAFSTDVLHTFPTEFSTGLVTCGSEWKNDLGSGRLRGGT